MIFTGVKEHEQAAYECSNIHYTLQNENKHGI